MNRSARAASAVSFLVAQIGAHASERFAERLEPLGLKAPEAGVLRTLGESPGISQQELAERLRMHASRLVGLLDAMEKRGLVTRKSSGIDRRVNALELSGEGQQMLGRLGATARAHDDALCAGLTVEERAQLRALLERIVLEQRLAPGIHPGYRKATAE